MMTLVGVVLPVHTDADAPCLENKFADFIFLRFFAGFDVFPSEAEAER